MKPTVANRVEMKDGAIEVVRGTDEYGFPTVFARVAIGRRPFERRHQAVLHRIAAAMIDLLDTHETDNGWGVSLHDGAVWVEGIEGSAAEAVAALHIAASKVAGRAR